MCGLITLAHTSASTAINIKALTDRISHRGPDDHGWLTWDGKECRAGRDETTVRGKVIMGHRRLSIIDLSVDGHQPMSSADKQLHIAYNGEVYNYLELRAELELLGHQFHTRTDTEVILAALRQWGILAVSRFKGMFSFTVLDSKQRKLYAVRDHFGIKPLYYSRYQNGLAFASEINPLLELPGVSREPNAQAVYDYLQFGNTAHNENTLFADVKQLAPAMILEVNLDNLSISEPQKYWCLDLEEDDCGGYEQATRNVRDLFLENIKLHLRSDVPVGSALSGGIDSSAIVCAIRAVQPNADLHTFSFIAPGPLSEEPWVDLVNKRVQANGVKVFPEASDLFRDLDDLVCIQGQPFGSTSIYAQYCVFRTASAAGIKVMLDGQGADEMLAGYAGYQGSYLASLLRQKRIIQALQFWRKSSRWPKRSLSLIAQLAARQLLAPEFQSIARRLAGRPLVPNWINSQWLEKHGVNITPPIKYSKTRYCLRESLISSIEKAPLPELLRYEDLNSMRFSVESRVPFLTHDFAQLLISLPEAYIIDNKGDSKHIFKQAMRGLVPNEILDRRDKVGFEAPDTNWSSHLLGSNPELIKKICALPIINNKSAAYYINRQELGSSKYIWRMINLAKWLDIFSVSC